MRRQKVFRREETFAKNVNSLDDLWFHRDDLLILKDRNYGFAEFWKYQTYFMQKDATLALIQSHSNRYPFIVRKVIKKNGRLVFSSLVVMKAFYLRYYMLLIQGCGDKLAQMVRYSLGINKWKKKDNKETVAKEQNTTLIQLKSHLKLTLEENMSLTEREMFQDIYTKIRDYLDDATVKKILGNANAIKHRWTLFYQGEGLQPVKPKIEKVKGKKGNLIGEKLPIVAYTHGENIEEHIKLCVTVNNKFVDMANGILALLNPDKFYEFKNGKKILRF